MNYLKLATEAAAYVAEKRRHAHRHPELTWKEFETLKFIGSELTALGVRWEEVPHGGILGYIEGNTSGKTILLRADIDALPITETDENLVGKRCCKSENPGVMHACGHDGHIAMLLGAAKIANEHKDELAGNVIVMFERGEEGGGNLLFLLRHLRENNIKVDAAWSMHVMPDIPTGKMYISDDNMMAGIYRFEARITGRGGHGSRPDKANSPIDCFMAVYNGLNLTRVRYCTPFSPITFSVGLLEAGAKANVIPEKLTFSGSARYYGLDNAETFRSSLKNLLDSECRRFGMTYELNEVGPRLPLINNTDCARLAKETLQEKLPGLLFDGEPAMCSESIGYIHQYAPGVNAFLGIGNQAVGSGSPLHTPEFDIDEDGLTFGVAATLAYVDAFLTSDRPIDFTPFEGTPDELYASAGEFVTIPDDVN